MISAELKNPLFFDTLLPLHAFSLKIWYPQIPWKTAEKLGRREGSDPFFR